MARKGWSGSPRHTGAVHGGKIAGAGQVKTGEPGKFAKSVRTEGMGNRDANGLENQGRNPSGSSPPGMSVYRAGDPPPKGYRQ
jgi:hypothetical protein